MLSGRDVDQDVDQVDEFWDRLKASGQQHAGEVMAQGAAGAEAAAVVFVFGSAAVTVQVGRDAGALAAEQTLAVTARKLPLLAALRAGAESSGGLVESDAADLAVGPADADLAGAAPAPVAGVGAGRAGSSALWRCRWFSHRAGCGPGRV